MLVCTFLLLRMHFFRLPLSAHRQTQKPAHRCIQTNFLFFILFFKVPSTPPEKPFLSTLCLDVFCRQTSNSLWENKIAPCYCYPKVWLHRFIAVTGGRIWEKEECRGSCNLFRATAWKDLVGITWCWVPQVQLLHHSYPGEPFFWSPQQGQGSSGISLLLALFWVPLCCAQMSEFTSRFYSRFLHSIISQAVWLSVGPFLINGINSQKYAN